MTRSQIPLGRRALGSPKSGGSQAASSVPATSDFHVESGRRDADGRAHALAAFELDPAAVPSRRSPSRSSTPRAGTWNRVSRCLRRPEGSARRALFLVSAIPRPVSWTSTTAVQSAALSRTSTRPPCRRELRRVRDLRLSSTRSSRRRWPMTSAAARSSGPARRFASAVGVAVSMLCATTSSRSTSTGRPNWKARRPRSG